MAYWHEPSSPCAFAVPKHEHISTRIAYTKLDASLDGSTVGDNEEGNEDDLASQHLPTRYLIALTCGVGGYVSVSFFMGARMACLHPLVFNSSGPHYSHMAHRTCSLSACPSHNPHSYGQPRPFVEPSCSHSSAPSAIALILAGVAGDHSS